MSTSDEKDTIKDYNFTQLNPEKSQEEADEITLSHDNESVSSLIVFQTQVRVQIGMNFL